MGNLVFQATLGGQVNLVGPNTASTFNINVPTVNGNMVTTGDTGTVTNTMLAGSIANAKLTNSSVTIGGTSIALGASSSAITNDITINGATVGRGAGAVSTNTAVGASALSTNSTGGFTTAVGFEAAKVATAGDLDAFGYQALKANTTGTANSAFGTIALTANTTGVANIAVGRAALNLNTTGSYNTAVGRSALEANTTASNNTAVGYQAGYNVNGSNYSVFVGSRSASSGAAVITGNYHTCVGDAAGFALQGTSSNNALFGQNSGSAITTGSKNTVIGSYTGNQASLDIRTANNYIVLSDGDGNPRAWWGANGAGTNWACAKSDGDITMYYGPADLSPSATRSARLGFITTSVSKNWYITHNWNISGALEFVQTTASGGSAMSGTAAFYLNSSGNGVFTGSLSKGSGSFRIDHPLPELEETHQLVHSFIEGPQADLIYRGKVNLVAGRAEVNIDLASGMTDGTFVALCREVQCFTTNESDWVHVRGSVNGNVLTIEAQDQTATSLISWMVIGERQDKHMMDTDWTDDNGKVIVEPFKPPKIERTESTEV